MNETELRLWPLEASEDYVVARRDLLQAETDLIEHVERVAAMRRALPLGPIMREYEFDEGPRDLAADEPVQRTRLADLVADGRPAVIYHLMFHPDEGEACPMCSMWVDGLSAVARHLDQNVNFAVVGKAPLPRLRGWARRRGWGGARLLSSFGSTFNVDLGAEDASGAQQPEVSVFVRAPEGVRHVYTIHASGSMVRHERGLDLLSPVWNVLDLTPAGRGDWYAENSYIGGDGA